MFIRRLFVSTFSVACVLASTGSLCRGVEPPPALLFHLSAARGTTADFAVGAAAPNFDAEVAIVADGASGPALRCGDRQRLSWWAPGNIHAQRGTLSFFWRARDPVGPTEFPIFRVAFADHSSWDMAWLRIDYNGHGFDAFVTDASLARTRVSTTLDPFPAPTAWTHLALTWDETRGVRFFVNGRLAAAKDVRARFDVALDQFGPHSRIISPHQVQSDYNFVRGGDVDEIRIYDRMLDDAAIVALSRAEAPAVAATPARTLADPAVRAEWAHRHGWELSAPPPPALPARAATIRAVGILEAYDLKRWWWKANDGIRETTWPGVYNRSALPGRNDYFQLPDWDCYSLSGRAVTFTLPPGEAVNHIEISGAAFGRVERVGEGDRPEGAQLFTRERGRERTIHRLATPLVGGRVRFTNVQPEQPIGEFSAFRIVPGREPADAPKLEFRLAAPATAAGADAALAPLRAFIAGRHPVDERATLVAVPAAEFVPEFGGAPAGGLPVVHVLVPDTWDARTDGLDGVAIELPALPAAGARSDLIPLNLQVKDPLWPMRNLIDVTFSVRAGEATTVWLDLRDRLLPPGRPLYLSVAADSPALDARALAGAALRLVFKPREAALPEHVADRFAQVRDAYAMLVEERPASPQFNLWNRYRGDLADLMRVAPQHEPGWRYDAVTFPERPRPALALTDPAPGVPLWAARQVELLRRVKQFALYYVDHRQIANGEFGGGLSDDTDFTNHFPGIALMGGEPEKLAASLRRILDACYENGMVTRGVSTIQTDELHSYEEGINALGQALILDPSSPRQLERAMETTRTLRDHVTGINAAGHRHIRSSYYSGTKFATDGPWGWSKPYSYLVLQPAELLADFNGNAAARQLLRELADGLLDHRRPAADGKPASLAAAIHFETDAEAPATRGYFPWQLFWNQWRWTGERRYLDPLFDGGDERLLAMNPNVLDQLGLRGERGARILDTVRRAPVMTERPMRPADFHDAHEAWQLTGDKSFLEKLYTAQIEHCDLLHYINTEGSLWIDRVSVPIADLQRARLGGVALVRNSIFPGHVAGWRFAKPDDDERVAILIPDATPTAFTVIARNLAAEAVTARLVGGIVEPGDWEIVQGVDADGDDRADATAEPRVVTFGRQEEIDVTLPAGVTSVLTLHRKTSGAPYAERPDLGIEREDVIVGRGEIRVRVHSLGAVASPAAKVTVRDAVGAVMGSASLESLPAPADLHPKTAEVVVKLPAGYTPRDVTVSIETAGDAVPEITRANNVVRL